MPLPECVEERLELCIDYGANGGPEFKTTVVQVGNGRDYRNVDWPRHRGSWEIGDRVVSNEELDLIQNFFMRRRGRAIGFRWKDWSEYTLVDQVARRLSNTEFQVVKTYGERDVDSIYSVDITKPLSSTFEVKLDGIVLSQGWAVDDTTGILKLDSNTGGEVQVTGEFDKKVRFDVDTFDVTFRGHDEFSKQSLFDVSAIPIIELI